MNGKMSKPFTFHVDLMLVSRATNSVVAEIKTNDLNTVVFNITVRRGNLPFTLTGANVRLNIEKPDGLLVLVDGHILEGDQGLCQFTLPKQAYIVGGRHKAELMITFEHNKISVTKEFHYMVERGIIDDDVIESRDDWGSLSKVIEVADFLKDIDASEIPEAIDRSHEAMNTARDAKAKATDAEDAVESLRDLVNSGTGERLPYLIDGGYFDDPEEPVGISVDGGDF